MNKFIKIHSWLLRKFNILNVGLGIVIGAVKYIACHAFSCALSWFITSILIGSIVFSVYKNIANKIISKKVAKVITEEESAPTLADKINAQDVQVEDVKEVKPN